MKDYKFDYLLLITVVFLSILGIVFLSGISADISQNILKNSAYYFFHQLIWGFAIGILGAFVAFKTPLSFFKKWAWVLVLINLIVMALVFIPGLGIISGGAPRWLNLGFSTFQPSEFLKLSVIIYLSALLAKRTKKDNKDLIFLPFIIVLAVISVLLYFQSDASTLILIGVIAIIMYIISGVSIWHIPPVILLGIIGSAYFIFEPYRMNRVLVFLGLLKDPLKLGYQIEQALITIGSGGILGLGLGMSSQKISGLLPQIMSDSIFAIIAEELGFIGSFILVFAFLFLFWRSFKIVKNSKDKFCQLFAAGFSSWICIQAFINIGALIEILPVTGIPLPFISYGGTHIVAELIGVGLLLNVSKSLKK